MSTCEGWPYVDLLPSPVALIDERGRVVRVNAAWTATVASLRFPGMPTGVGDSYLTACEAVSGPNAFETRAVGDGLRRVLKGTIARFELEHSCHEANRERWCRVTIVAYGFAASAAALVR